MIKKLISAIFGSSKPAETNSTLPATISKPSTSVSAKKKPAAKRKPAAKK